jgi:hypothetical protein
MTFYREAYNCGIVPDAISSILCPTFCLLLIRTCVEAATEILEMFALIKIDTMSYRCDVRLDCAVV